MIWTDEAIQTLKLMLPDHSASYIGKALGCTKNAVIGKANRLGLKKCLPVQVVKKDGPKTLLELGNRDCRWPVEGKDKDTLFCAKPVKDGKPFCEAHCERAYRKVGEPHDKNKC